MAVTVERMNEIRDERISELRTYGLQPRTAGVAGAITLSATDAASVLQMLRKFREWGKQPQNGGVRIL